MGGAQGRRQAGRLALRRAAPGLTARRPGIRVEVVGSMLQLIPKVRDGILAENNRKWREWLERKAAAERAGLPFDEPPPG